LEGLEISTTWDGNGGGNPQDPPGNVYRRAGKDYRAGDTLPDGRWIESVEDGIPVLIKRKPKPPISEMDVVHVPDVLGQLRLRPKGPVVDVEEVKEEKK
jgi:hypothetical protein